MHFIYSTLRACCIIICYRVDGLYLPVCLQSDFTIIIGIPSSPEGIYLYFPVDASDNFLLIFC